jgi:hypothetical protein
VGSPSSRLAMSCCTLVLVCTLPGVGQFVREVAPPGTATATTMRGQVFHCHTGYPLAQCQQDILQLKRILAHYPIEELGHWTWVLVRSQDWKPISRVLRLSPESPAFTALEPRETFLEEALFAHDAERTAELMHQWAQSMPQLLEFAVSHELGHAFCEDTNEAAADRFGAELRKGSLPRCEVAKEAKKKSMLAGEAPRPKPNTLRAP